MAIKSTPQPVPRRQTGRLIPLRPVAGPAHGPSDDGRPGLARGGSGTVTLVGAGPGDPELLTLKAVRAIQAATLILVDDLVGDGVLAYAAPSTRVIHVGKRGGCKSTPQAFIEGLMITHARQGHRVVRLKGGDPFIFGRGGEEVEHLQRAGVEVRVINGITSGLAAANTLGVALTHREHAHGVLFVTGHGRTEADTIDWTALAATVRDVKLTLVIYMGLRGAAAIQQGLLSGLSAGTPAAVIERASLPEERSVVTTLGALLRTIESERLSSPCIIVVGDVLRGAAAALAQPGLQRAV